MTRYTLPDLPYGTRALEPLISSEIMELHHDVHHRGYVDAANATIGKLIGARASGELDSIAELERSLAFHVSGHVLHSIFWKNLTPNGGGQPTGDIADAI